MTAPHPSEYVAFLRGINVGGNKPVKMAELKKIFESLGYEGVKTILASGNVLFTSASTSPATIAKKIERALETRLAMSVGVVVWSMADIRKLVAADPFKDIDGKSKVRRYVTFLPVNPYGEISKSKFGLAGCKIVRQTETEICIALAPDIQSTDVMTNLDRCFGRSITTRNWNTIEKIIASSK